MTLNVSDALHHPGQDYAFQGEQTIAPVEIGGDIVSFDTALLKGTFFTADDGSVTVDGRLTTVAHAHCANCLEPAMAEIDTPFHETFQRNGDPSDDEIFAYEGYRVEFDKLAMSYAVLALPIRLLCKEDCPGLGETHPVDVDFSLCQKELPGQHPFAALQQLLTKDEEV